MHGASITTWDGLALIVRLFSVAVLLTTGITSPLIASEKLSAVQAAAAARLAERLGRLRGTVKPEDQLIFVTPELLENKSTDTIEAPTDSIQPQPPVENKSKLPPIVWNMSPNTNLPIGKIKRVEIQGVHRQFARFPAVHSRDLENFDAGGKETSFLKQRFEEIEQLAGEKLGGIIPKPVTKVRIFAGGYSLDLPVRHK